MHSIPSHRSSAMLSLHSDILFTIISLLTEEFSTDDASKSIRNCSQICRFWRHLILDSPSIWGKLINFDDFRHSNDQWMEEVLHRSGSSLLWITGRVCGKTADRTRALETFFFSILNNHWNRIQKIQIHVEYFDEQGRLFWKPVFRPAPHLQVFEVHRPTSSMPWFYPPSMFADYAPSLRAYDASVFPIAQKAPWLSGLRAVRFYFPLDLPQALDALGAMHLLESLTISLHDFTPDSKTRPITDADEPTVHLPNLSQLFINTNLSTALRVIAALCVPPGCSFGMKYLGGDIITEPITYVHLLKLTQNYFQSYRPKQIWLTSWDHQFLFSDTDPMNPDALQRTTSFFFIRMTSPTVIPETIRLLTRAVTLPPLDMSSVTHLHVISEGVFARHTSHELFSSLTAIKTLTITEDMISYLFLSLSLKKNPNNVFPLLRIIRVEGWKEGQERDDNLDTWLQERKNAGRPILVLCIPK